ncbi:hypothetical protein RBSWK_06473 [Rhodopirellula baltica SWK14]|uniref:Uncharacterized protein n=1 Tax=Rhodopirellula baltica SWK14 TaxID=993516 RepID=L7C7G1_RHOBT|nr:hypothetical protein RBSWK_06473 [Rhodopirellula baltica SWK14]
MTKSTLIQKLLRRNFVAMAGCCTNQLERVGVRLIAGNYEEFIPIEDA